MVCSLLYVVVVCHIHLSNLIRGEIEKDTVGKQLVKAADSVGSNIAEGSGRGSYSDNNRFVKIARGSLFETKHWINKAFKRELIIENDYKEMLNLIEELIPRLSAFINYLTKKCNK